MTLTLVALLAFFRSPMGSLADTVALETEVAYGPVRLWGSLGFLVAAVGGGRYLDPTSSGLLVAIALSLAVAALSAILLPSRGDDASSRPAEQMGRGSSFEVPSELRLLVAWALALEAAHSAYDLCYSLHLRDHGVNASTAGILWALGVLAEIGFFLAGERLLARFGASRLLIAGTLALALRLVVLPHARALPALVALQGLHAFTFGATWTALMRIVRERALPGTLGRLRGLFSVTAAIGGACGMVAWGTSYRGLGGPTTFRCAAAVASLALVLALASGRRLLAFPAPSAVG
jgi:PPP family 3-phenylpropionic acid transporter